MSLSVPVSRKTNWSATRLPWAFAFVLAGGAILAPALWNGFPLVFADTGGYLARPFEQTLLIGRSVLYGLVLTAALPWDFWPSIVLQAAAAAWVILLVLRLHGLARRPGLAAALSVALAAFTGLPWNASMLMPDIFAPLTVLGLHLLAFRHADLTRSQAAGLALLVAFGSATHMGTLALGFALFGVYAALRMRAPRLTLPRPRLAPAFLSLLTGVALALGSNVVVTGKAAFTPGGIHFLFGRLLQDGIVARHLAERCPDTSLRLCAYRDALPRRADDWLWGWESPLYKLGGPEGFAPEARAIVWATLSRYPLEQVTSAFGATAQQLVRVRTGEGVNPHDTEHAVRALLRYAPAAMPRFAAARQQHDAFDFTLLNRLQVPLALASLLLLPVIALARRRLRIPSADAALAVSALAGLILNAAICGVFSNPNDRYQSRIAWLAPLALAVAGLSRRVGPDG